tara:strand:+ start:623 stop:862 length:240 start_codon:yes stop_codon:yes gene_type:complete
MLVLAQNTLLLKTAIPTTSLAKTVATITMFTSHTKELIAGFFAKGILTADIALDHLVATGTALSSAAEVNTPFTPFTTK